VELTSLFGPVKLAWDRLLEHARGKLVVHVRVHHGYLGDGKPAYFINVQNESPQRSVQVTHVWLESKPPVPVLTKPLPRTISPNTEWETFILEKDAPANSLTTIVDLTRVRLSGEHVLRAEMRADTPPAGHIPDG
jgi:hypothetical protein